MLFGDDGITIKQLSYLLVSQGFKKCELWDAVDYSMAHHHSKEYRLHVVNGIILKNLIKIGFCLIWLRNKDNFFIEDFLNAGSP